MAVGTVIDPRCPVCGSTGSRYGSLPPFKHGSGYGRLWFCDSPRCGVVRWVDTVGVPSGYVGR